LEIRGLAYNPLEIPGNDLVGQPSRAKKSKLSPMQEGGGCKERFKGNENF